MSPTTSPAERRRVAREQARAEQAESDRLMNIVIERDPKLKEEVERADLRVFYVERAKALGEVCALKPDYLVRAWRPDYIPRVRQQFVQWRAWMDAVEKVLPPEKGLRLVMEE